MIKTAITGGHTPTAAHLLRLLLHHPDIEVVAVVTPSAVLAGRAIAGFHPGLDGEQPIRFTTALPSAVDVLFVADGEPPLSDGTATTIISFDGADPDAVYGLPELNRKPLVRGATRACIASADAAAIVTPLLPFAANLLLNSRISVAIEQGETDVTLPAPRDGEIADALRSLQNSFDSPIEITRTRARRCRGTVATIDITTRISSDDARQLALDYFDDHNLTHVIDRRPEASDVVGTGKCLVSVEPKEDGVRIISAIDGPMKGRVSQAVHVMNLLHGLHERTGLSLPAFTF